MSEDGKCQHLRHKCLESRQKSGYRWRRYQCNDCGSRYSTVELEIPPSKKGESVRADNMLIDKIIGDFIGNFG